MRVGRVAPSRGAATRRQRRDYRESALEEDEAAQPVPIV